MYNFVIFGTNWDLYKISYNDAIRLSNVRYISTPYQFRSSVLKQLYRLYWSPKINRVIDLPYKGIWNSGYFKFDFQDDNPICFIFFGSWSKYAKTGLVKYLRNKYANSKHVCFFQDLVDLTTDINISQIKDLFDLVISFDHSDSKKYGLEYHQLVFSNSNTSGNHRYFNCDIYFLGKAKDRLNEIIHAYKFLKSYNLKCDFYLVGVASNKQVYADEIHYIDSMLYIENLQHVISSKCLLEIMQKGGHGYTQRMCEAIAYDKKIITNNVEVKNAPFYNPNNILYIEEVGRLASSKRFFEDFTRIANHEYKDKISPIRLLEFVSDKLQTLKESAL